MLTYPVVDHYTGNYPSYVECAKGQALTTPIMHWFWDHYLGGVDPHGEAASRAYPIRSALLNILPPAILCTCGRDPLRDEGIALNDKLEAAGVSVEYRHYPESEHGFACSMGDTSDYRDWLESCAEFVRRFDDRPEG